MKDEMKDEDDLDSESIPERKERRVEMGERMAGEADICLFVSSAVM